MTAESYDPAEVLGGLFRWALSAPSEGGTVYLGPSDPWDEPTHSRFLDRLAGTMGQVRYGEVFTVLEARTHYNEHAPYCLVCVMFKIQTLGVKSVVDDGLLPGISGWICVREPTLLDTFYSDRIS